MIRPTDIQKALRQWIKVDHWNDPRSVTLTMNQYLYDKRTGRDFIQLTPDLASINLRHFLNALNRETFGNRWQRYGKRLSVLPILEGGSFKHLHYHLSIDCPFAADPDNRFERLIRDAWSKTLWAAKQVAVGPADNIWVDYITKLKDKPDFADSIDWNNTHVADGPPIVVCHC